MRVDQPKCGIVTGGASGIGLAVARLLAAQGCNVLVVDLGPGGRAIEPEPGISAIACHAGDVVDPGTAISAIADLAERGWSLDFLVNAAGVSQAFVPLHETSSEEFARVQAVNLVGTFNMYREVAKAMIAQGRGGSIVNIASTAGIRPVPNAGSYTASKRAVVGLTEVAALEVAQFNIRVNAVCPGVTDTPMFRAAAGSGPPDQLAATIPIRRLADATMIADAVSWLISDAASYVTGVSLPVDGGLQLV